MEDASERVVVVAYDPAWVTLFRVLRDRAAAALGDLAVAVEHVGSTAVPGLPAKPIVDLDVVVAAADVPAAVARLATLGYVHRGDLGIPGREAFARPPGTPAHHLYVCPRDSRELRRHLRFRDRLRTHPEEARAYAAIKRDAAARFPEDRAAYTEAKGAFVEQVLRRASAEDGRA